VKAIYRAGRGHSIKYTYVNIHGGSSVTIYTYQGNGAEYIIFEKLGICSCRTRYRLDNIIFEKLGICSCRTRYRLDKQKGLICYHLISFAW